MLGGSRVQIGGPTAAFVVIICGIIEKYTFTGLVIATILAGIMMIIFGLIRAGNLINTYRIQLQRDLPQALP